MPNQTENYYYFNLSNFEEAKTLSQSIVVQYGLTERESVKDYGTVKTSDDYSVAFKNWDNLTDEYLLRNRTLENPLYNLWNGIKARCYDSNSIGYSYYGGRGITMNPDWKDNFLAFGLEILGTLGKKPHPFYSIERKDPSGNYVIENMMWAAPIKQGRNKNGVKVTEKSGLVLAMLYKYYKVTGRQLQTIYNDSLAEDEAHKITKSYAPVYTACRSYCQLV